MRLRFGLLIIVGLLGCSPSDKDVSNRTTDSLANEKVYTAATLDEYKSMYAMESYQTQIDDSKAETIDFDCAILIYPIDVQIEEMKRTLGEEDFYVVADDNNWYQGIAIEMIDSVGIDKITARGQYLKLQGENKIWTLDIRKDNMPSWNLIFFKRTKEPQIIPTVDLTVDQIRDYFELAQ